MNSIIQYNFKVDRNKDFEQPKYDHQDETKQKTRVTQTF